jgi:hypothetical protein
MNSATILIGGDVFPSGRAIPFFEQGDARAIFNDIVPEFEAADLSIINLECPLVDEGRPIRKIGPHLSASPACADAIKNAGIDVVNLANNHNAISGNDSGYSGLQVVELDITGHVNAPSVPIPSTFWLIGAGLAGLIAIRRRKQTTGKLFG